MNKRSFNFDKNSHTYTDDRNYAYTSVTTVIHKYVPPFDRVKHAKRLARNGKGHYEGKGWREILSMWDTVTDTALDKGNNRHDYLEQGVKTSSGFQINYKSLSRSANETYTIQDILIDHDYGLVDLVMLEQEIGIKYPKIWEAISYYVNLGFRVYSEIVVYDDKYLISGMIDLLLVHPDKRFVIIDWKTNKHDIVFKSGYFKRDADQQTTSQWISKSEYFLAPLDSLEYCNGNVYAMQLSLYSRLAEKFGLTFEYIVLCHIREHYQLNKYGMPYRDSNGQFITIPELGERVEFHGIPFYKGYVDTMVNHHYNKTTGIYGMQGKIF